ncbi:MAG: DsrE/DsrF/TusD sulfur relay family protein [Promethearchaeota archaeon]
MKYAFIVMTEYIKYQHIYSLLKLVEAARAKDHSILGIFFFGTGVLNIKKDIRLGKSTRNIPLSLEKLNVPMFACSTWADNYGIRPENAILGVKIAGLGELSEITSKADKLITFGVGN